MRLSTTTLLLTVIAATLSIAICYQCNLYESTSPSVCSGHGVCTSQDNCTCSSQWTTGDCSVYNTGNGIEYIVTPSLTTRSDAENYCLSVSGGFLTSILSAQENSIVYTVAQQTQITTPIWIGIIGDGSNFNSMSWDDGNDISYTNFDPADSAPTSLFCTTINPSLFGVWKYSSCSVSNRAICKRFKCGSLYNSDQGVCSAQGNCISPDNCQCIPGYGGTACDQTACGGVVSTDPQTCSSHGTCTGPEDCACQAGYIGDICSYPVCYNIAANVPGSCSGNGECTAPNTCTCSAGYYDLTCDKYKCNGVNSTLSTVCLGRGECIAPNVCSCDNNAYTGANCQYPLCNGVSSVSSLVCSGRGSCTSPGVCSCSGTSTGQWCQYSTCFGISELDGQVCSGHGSCIGANVCQCDQGYTGSKCEYPICYNVPSFETDYVCSGNLTGTCTQHDQCSCSTGYFGDHCEWTSCFGLGSDNVNTCSSHGVCEKYNQCSCNEGFSGQECQFPVCNGTVGALACSNHGICASPDYCQCSDGYQGRYCQYPMCYSIGADNLSACNRSGDCTQPGSCLCRDNYSGDKCTDFTCNSCEWDATCIGPGICICGEMEDLIIGIIGFGPTCSQYVVEDNNGTAVPQDYISENTTIRSCFGYLGNNSAVCSGNGVCVSHNHCVCNATYVSHPGIFHSGMQCDTLSSCKSYDNIIFNASGIMSAFSAFNSTNSQYIAYKEMIKSEGVHKLMPCESLMNILYRDYPGYISITDGCDPSRLTVSPLKSEGFVYDSSIFIQRPLIRYGDDPIRSDSFIRQGCAGAVSDVDSYVAYDPKFANPTPFCSVNANYTVSDIINSLDKFGSLQDAINTCGNAHFEPVILESQEPYPLDIYYTIHVNGSNLDGSYTLLNTTLHEKITIVLKVMNVYLRKVQSSQYKYRTISLDSRHGIYSNYSLQNSQIRDHFSSVSPGPPTNESSIVFWKHNTHIHCDLPSDTTMCTIEGDNHNIISHNQTFERIRWTRISMTQFPIVKIGSSGIFTRFERNEFSQFTDLSLQRNTAPAIVYSMCGYHSGITNDTLNEYRELNSGFYSRPSIEYPLVNYNTVIRNSVFSTGKESIVIHYSSESLSALNQSTCPLDSNMKSMYNIQSFRLMHRILIEGNTFTGSNIVPLYIGDLIPKYDRYGGLQQSARCKCLPIDVINVLSNTFNCTDTAQIASVHGTVQLYFNPSLISNSNSPISTALYNTPANEEPFSIRILRVQHNTFLSVTTESVYVLAKTIQSFIQYNQFHIKTSNSRSVLSPYISPLLDLTSNTSVIQVYCPYQYGLLGSLERNKLVINENSFRAFNSTVCLPGSKCFYAAITVSSAVPAMYSLLDISSNEYVDSRLSGPGASQQSSIFSVGISVITSSSQQLITLIKNTYGISQYYPTSNTEYQRAAWNYRIRNMELAGNEADVRIRDLGSELSPPFGSIALKTLLCERECKGNCNTCTVDQTRYSPLSTISPNCFSRTKFSTIADALSNCMHSTVELLPIRYSMEDITIATASEITIRSMPSNQASIGPLGPSSLTILPMAVIPMATATTVPSHPIYLHSQYITIQRVRFEIGADLSQYNVETRFVFARSSTLVVTSVSLLTLDQCEFWSDPSSVSGIFETETVNGKITTLHITNCTITSFGERNTPAIVDRLIFSGNTIVSGNGVIEVSPRKGVVFNYNSAINARISSSNGLVVSIHDSNCQSGCSIHDNYIQGPLPAITTAPPTTANYGDSALISLSNMAIGNRENIHSNLWGGVAYGISYTNLSPMVCNATEARNMKRLNSGMYGAIYDICCDKGLVTEYCCKGSCRPPQPNPSYCIVDSTADQLLDDYEWVYFPSLSRALIGCTAQPSMNILVRSELSSAAGSTLLFKHNNANQTSINVYSDPSYQYPVIKGSGHGIDASAKNVSIQGLRFEAASGAYMLGGVSHTLSVDDTQFVCVTQSGGPGCGTILYFAAYNGTISLSNLLLDGSTSIGVYIYVVDINHASTSMNNIVAKNQHASFMKLVNVYSLSITNTECSEMCGAIVSGAYYAIIDIRFTNGDGQSNPLVKLHLLFENNTIAVSNPGAQIYQSLSGGGYLAGLWLHDAASYVTSYGISKVELFRVRNNQISGFNVGTRLSGMPNNLLVLNEPTDSIIISNDKKRYVREFAVNNNNLVQGIKYDVVNGVTALDSMPSITLYCNDLCIPSNANLCYVSREYNPSVTGWGTMAFATISSAQSNCIYSPVNIMVQQLSQQNREGINGDSVYHESLSLGRTDRDVIIQGETNPQSEGSYAKVVISGCHTISSSSRRMGLSTMRLVSTCNSAALIRSSSSYIHASLTLDRIQVNQYTTDNATSLLSLKLTQGSFVNVSNCQMVGSSISPQNAQFPSIDITYQSCPSVNSLIQNQVVLYGNTIERSYIGAISVKAASVLNVTNNVVLSCDATVQSRQCVYLEKCNALPPYVTVKTNSVTVTSGGVIPPTNSTGAQGYYTAIRLEYLSNYGQNETADSIILLNEGIALNSAVSSGVGIRVLGLSMDYLCAEGEFTDCISIANDTESRGPARALSKSNPASAGSFYEIVLLIAQDSIIMSNLSSTKPYYCTAQCPRKTISELLLVEKYFLIGVVTALVVWCLFLGGMWVICCEAKKTFKSVSAYRRLKKFEDITNAVIQTQNNQGNNPSSGQPYIRSRRQRNARRMSN